MAFFNDNISCIIIFIIGKVDCVRSQRNNILNNKGPNIDPCGTPSKMSTQELYFELTLVLSLRFCK